MFEQPAVKIIHKLWNNFRMISNFFLVSYHLLFKKIVKISERYLKSLLSNSKSTKFHCPPWTTKWAFCTSGCLK